MSDLVLYTDADMVLKGSTLLEMAKKHKLKYFIETGTYSGEMIIYVNARHKFRQIISIELSERLWQRATDIFKDDKHIILLQGDSGEVLPKIAISEPTLFWLDAHWSGGVTARGKKITPLMAELGAILNDMPHVIVIDDLNYLPRWGVDIRSLQEHILSVKPNVTIVIRGKMMIVEPKVV